MNEVSVRAHCLMAGSAPGESSRKWQLVDCECETVSDGAAREQRNGHNSVSCQLAAYYCAEPLACP